MKLTDPIQVVNDFYEIFLKSSERGNSRTSGEPAKPLDICYGSGKVDG